MWLRFPKRSEYPTKSIEPFNSGASNTAHLSALLSHRVLSHSIYLLLMLYYFSVPSVPNSDLIIRLSILPSSMFVSLFNIFFYSSTLYGFLSDSFHLPVFQYHFHFRFWYFNLQKRVVQTAFRKSSSLIAAQVLKIVSWFQQYENMQAVPRNVNIGITCRKAEDVWKLSHTYWRICHFFYILHLVNSSNYGLPNKSAGI